MTVAIRELGARELEFVSGGYIGGAGQVVVEKGATAVGAAAGAWAGARVGALIGLEAGPLGGVIGGALGGIAGAVWGYYATH
jgi:hypothetical protein